MAFKDKSKARIYKAWNDMRRRCRNPRERDYHRYGGRGITVCPEWETNFHAFYRWALQSGYADHLTIDRIDNDGNYCPENCRWATHLEQSLTRSTTRHIAREDMELYIALRWKLQGLSSPTICHRLRRGWSVRMALTTPVMRRRRKTELTINN